MEDKIPLRNDGKPDLMAWRKYVEDTGIASLSDIESAFQKGGLTDVEIHLLTAARSNKYDEIARSFASVLQEEGLNVECAISVLKMAKKLVMQSKFMVGGVD